MHRRAPSSKYAVFAEPRCRARSPDDSGSQALRDGERVQRQSVDARTSQAGAAHVVWRSATICADSTESTEGASTARTRMNAPTVAALILALASVPASAQWLNYPTPGLPRTADGKPDLNAPTPRSADGKPDLSGIWTKDTANALDYFYDLAKDLPPEEVVMTAWAAGIAQQREARRHVDDPWGYCAAPPGVPRID